jgi:transposase
MPPVSAVKWAAAIWVRGIKVKIREFLFIKLTLKDGQIVCERRQQAIERHLELTGCYVIVTDAAAGSMDTRRVQASYRSLQRVERDFRAMKTGALEVRPIFVQKASRTSSHVFCCILALKVVREIEQRLRAAIWLPPRDSNPDMPLQRRLSYH